MEDTNEIRYPIVFYSDDEFELFLESSGGATYGIEASDKNKIITTQKFIDNVNNGKFKLQAIDSFGNDYLVVNIKKRRMNFSILALLSFCIRYYVDFEFKKIGEYTFQDFHGRVLSMLKVGARKWKKEGHDNYSNSYQIGRVVRAASIKEIVEILLGKHWGKK